MKKCLQYKIQRESLELRLRAYMEMEIEFENMKEKVKYEGEYEELIVTTTISTIIHYIKESIPILINKKIEESKIKKKENENLKEVKDERTKNA